MGDIHNLQVRLANAQSNLEKSSLSAAHRKIIRDFIDDGLARGLSDGRVLKYLTVMKKIGGAPREGFRQRQERGHPARCAKNRDFQLCGMDETRFQGCAEDILQVAPAL